MSDDNEAPTVEYPMSQVNSLSSQLLDKDREIERLMAEEAMQQLEQSRTTAEKRITRLERELQQAEMRGELATLCGLEKLCVEHSQALEREAEYMCRRLTRVVLQYILADHKDYKCLRRYVWWPGMPIRKPKLLLSYL